MLHSHGASEKQIGEIMGIGEVTVQAILNSCVKTLKVNSHSQASVKAVQLGEFINVL